MSSQSINSLYITYGRAMQGYTIAYTDSKQLSKPQTTNDSTMHFHTPKLEPSAKTMQQCKAIPNFKAYADFGCVGNLHHCPKPRRVTTLCHLHKQT